MPWHTVAQGEWIDQIAQKYGFSAAAPVTDHADNADLVKKRAESTILLPGDRVFVPDRDDKAVEVPSGKAHRFKVKIPRTKVKIIVHDEEDQPIASKPFKLTLDGAVTEGTSDGDGLIEVAIPIAAVSAGELAIDGHTIPIRLGHLDPLDEISGVQGRLHNLGHDCGPVDGNPSDALTQAVQRFQKAMELEESGVIDDATRGKLKDKCGC